MKMVILDRYIGKNVLLSTLVVMSVLLALFTILLFMNEMKHVGKGNYDTLDAAQFSLLAIPGLIYQFFPIGAMLGTTIGLGMMASNGELVAIRAAGISLVRIILSVMKIGLLFVAVVLILGEGVAPEADRYAQTLRSVALSERLTLQGKDGLWARDGETFVNIRNVLPGERLGQVYLYERDGGYRLKRLVQAQSAAFRKGQWVLEQVVSSEFGDGYVNSVQQAKVPWRTQLSPDLLNIVTVQPNTLSIFGLYQYIAYLKENGLDAATYRQAFWGKVVAPVVTAVMVFLSIPFVFGPLRSVGVGHRILVGSLIGIGFYIGNQMFAYMGIVFGIHALLTALVPVGFAFGLGLVMLRRVT